MTHPREFRRPKPRFRHRGLLVCVLLLGLAGMHGLGQVPAPAAAPGHHRMADDNRTVAGAHASVPVLCGHGDHGPGGGHLEHADETCAAASVAGSPSMHAHALAPAIADGGARPDAATSLPVGSSDGGRAPPSLSELQLLRI